MVGWATSARSQDAFQSILSSREALELRLDLTTLSLLAMSENGLEPFKFPAARLLGSGSQSTVLGRKGGTRVSWLVLSPGWRQVGFLVIKDISLRALFVPGKALPGLVGGPGYHFP